MVNTTDDAALVSRADEADSESQPHISAKLHACALYLTFDGKGLVIHTTNPGGDTPVLPVPCGWVAAHLGLFDR